MDAREERGEAGGGHGYERRKPGGLGLYLASDPKMGGILCVEKLHRVNGRDVTADSTSAVTRKDDPQHVQLDVTS